MFDFPAPSTQDEADKVICTDSSMSVEASPSEPPAEIKGNPRQINAMNEEVEQDGKIASGSTVVKGVVSEERISAVSERVPVPLTSQPSTPNHP